MHFRALCSSSILSFALWGAATTSSQAQTEEQRLDVPANHCEVYVEKIQTMPNSHSSGSVGVVVRVPWLGNGEEIQLVGFYGHNEADDLGNAPDCHMAASYNDRTPKVYLAWSRSDLTSLGEYFFSFPVRSGSVLGQCPGYHYAWIGSFFVQTNFKTYWVNPDMNPSEQFYFDSNLYGNIDRRGTYAFLETADGMLASYNPLSCRR